METLTSDLELEIKRIKEEATNNHRQLECEAQSKVSLPEYVWQEENLIRFIPEGEEMDPIKIVKSHRYGPGPKDKIPCSQSFSERPCPYCQAIQKIEAAGQNFEGKDHEIGYSCIVDRLNEGLGTQYATLSIIAVYELQMRLKQKPPIEFAHILIGHDILLKRPGISTGQPRRHSIDVHEVRTPLSEDYSKLQQWKIEANLLRQALPDCTGSEGHSILARANELLREYNLPALLQEEE